MHLSNQSILSAVIGAAVAGAAMATPPGVDQGAIYKAAGATRQGDMWVICTDEPNKSGARIEQVRDLNGDGRPEAVVVEDGTFCNGASETGFTLLTRRADGQWQVVESDSGMPEFLASRGRDGWPDISVGGPGFCFPVLRWNGNAYAVQRHEYEGKPCKPAD